MIKSNKIIKIQNSSVEFIDATNIWGKTTSETERILNQKLGINFSFAVIAIAICIAVGKTSLVD